jgi:hypothetical protein
MSIPMVARNGLGELREWSLGVELRDVSRLEKRTTRFNAALRGSIGVAYGVSVNAGPVAEYAYGESVPKHFQSR